MVADKARLFASGSSGSSAFTRSIHAIIDDQRRQVRIGEVAIIVRVFLAAHGARFAAVRIVQPRLLHDAAAVLDQVDLAADFEFDRLLKEAEGVQVLDLAARAELRVARPGAPRRWRRSGRSLPACCRRRCRSSAPAHAASSRRHGFVARCACPARRRFRAAASRRGSDRCRSCASRSNRRHGVAKRGRDAATCPRLPRGARASGARSCRPTWSRS